MAMLDNEERRSCDALNELVTYGLLERQDDRWQISHALVHTYARTELALSKESLDRLASWYINFSETASEEGVKGYARLDAERAHCLRLIDICLTSKLWQNVKLLVRIIDIYLEMQGYWVEELAALEMSLMAARQAGDRDNERWCLNVIGCIYDNIGDCEQALAWYEQSLMIARELSNKNGENSTLNNIALIYQQQGKHNDALRQYEQSLFIAQEIGDRAGEGRTLDIISILLLQNFAINVISCFD